VFGETRIVHLVIFRESKSQFTRFLQSQVRVRTVLTDSSSCSVHCKSRSSSSSPIELETELSDEFLLSKPLLPGNGGGYNPFAEMGGVEGPGANEGKYDS